MTRPHRAGAPFVVLAVAALALTGCAEPRADEKLPQELTTQTSTPPPSATQVARDSARARVYEWVSGRNTILSSPEDYVDTSTIGFAEGREATELIAEAGDLRLKDRTLSGTAKLTVDPTVSRVLLDPPDRQGETVAPYVTVRGCIDESGTHLVDATGAKVKGSEGKAARPVSFHVLNRQYPDPAGWRIAWHTDLKGSC